MRSNDPIARWYVGQMGEVMPSFACAPAIEAPQVTEESR